MSHQRKKSRTVRQRGAEAIEFTFVMLPLFAMMFVLLNISWAVFAKSTLLVDIGAFLAFFAAFGQSMASVGTWAGGVSEALTAIPHLTRLRPLISTDAEVSEDRKSPGKLTGAVEFSRLTFRYVSSGPPVLDDVTFRVAPGEYVAIVGPSGSGKSSLFRLLLAFSSTGDSISR